MTEQREKFQYRERITFVIYTLLILSGEILVTQILALLLTQLARCKSMQKFGSNFYPFFFSDKVNNLFMIYSFVIIHINNFVISTYCHAVYLFWSPKICFFYVVLYKLLFMAKPLYQTSKSLQKSVASKMPAILWNSMPAILYSKWLISMSN